MDQRIKLELELAEKLFTAASAEALVAQKRLDLYNIQNNTSPFIITDDESDEDTDGDVDTIVSLSTDTSSQYVSSSSEYVISTRYEHKDLKSLHNQPLNKKKCHARKSSAPSKYNIQCSGKKILKEWLDRECTKENCCSNHQNDNVILYRPNMDPLSD